jgi:hypothetical protein
MSWGKSNFKPKIWGRTSRTGNKGKNIKDPLFKRKINPLNTELKPICHLMALLVAHHILHVSRIRVKEKLVSANKLVLSFPGYDAMKCCM